MTAAERVQESRARLRRVLAPPPVDPVLKASARRLPARGIAKWPSVEAALRSLNAWWDRQPLRPVGQLTGAALDAALHPVARQHPFVLVLSAGAAGGALVWKFLRRRRPGAVLLSGPLPRLATRALWTLLLEAWSRKLAASRPAHAA